MITCLALCCMVVMQDRTPNMRIRNCLRGVDVEKLESVTLYGPGLTRRSEESGLYTRITITSRKPMRDWLEAFKNSSRDKSIREEPFVVELGDTVEFALRPKEKGGKRRKIVFQINVGEADRLWGKSIAELMQKASQVK